MASKQVLIIGGGIAGITAANSLADNDISVTVVEKEPFLGGHALQYACKAADTCVKCGACLAEEKLKLLFENSNINKLLSTRVASAQKTERLTVTVESNPTHIDPAKCNGCQECLHACPEHGALIQSYTQYAHTPVAVQNAACLNYHGQQCRICQDACPEGAIDFNQNKTTATIDPDAVIIAAGFSPYNPKDKPYGYGHLPNVITNLELERMLRLHNRAHRPSDRAPAQRIAFIQCVGSRDAKLNHLWCSKVCCGSSLRMARLIKSREPQTEIVWFYIDVQTFGKNFQTYYEDCQKEIQMVRIIPGDIVPAQNDQLQISYFDNRTAKGIDALFDLAVLSIGMLPFEEASALSSIFDVERLPSGFLASAKDHAHPMPEGIFPTGSTLGPMSITETISSAQHTACQVINFLRQRDDHED